MLELPSLRPESRYGIPPADLFFFNRLYIVGYSYLFRQPKWAMPIIDDNTMERAEEDFDRLDNFREDMWIPDMFRSTLTDYKKSGYDRGYLIDSADRKVSEIVNSGTFLLSNMSPQEPSFNQIPWLKLEKAVRILAEMEEFIEVYTIFGLLVKIGNSIDVIGEKNIVVPDAFFKSILAERAKTDSQNQLEMWSFIIPNEGTDKPLKDFLIPTEDIERRIGLQLWSQLRGEKIDDLRDRKGKMWDFSD